MHLSGETSVKIYLSQDGGRGRRRKVLRRRPGGQRSFQNQPLVLDSKKKIFADFHLKNAVFFTNAKTIVR